MGAKTGSYSRFIYDKAKQYVYPLVPQGKAILDADFNDWFEILFNIQKDLLHNLSAGSFDDGVFSEDPPNPGGFEVVESSTENQDNFVVSPGDGYLQGLPLMLVEEDDDIEYLPDVDAAGATVGRANLHSRVTYVDYNILNPGYTTVKDSAMKWPDDAHNGREIVPDISDTTTAHTIADTKSDNEILISGDVSSQFTVGEPYLIKLSTPGGSRTDQIWLNTYLDEVDSVEDPDLLHPIKGGYEGCRRMKCRTIIEIEEDTGGSPAFATDYVDADGNQHYRVMLAEITRNDAYLETADITDQRVSLSSFSPVHNLVDHPDVSSDEAGAFQNMINPSSVNHILCKNDAQFPMATRIGLNIGFDSYVPAADKVSLLPGAWLMLADAPLGWMCRSDTTAFSQAWTTAMMVQVDAFVVADITTAGLNGLDTGSVANDTWYYIYVVGNPTTDAYGLLFSTNNLTPTLTHGSLSGYTCYRRIGACMQNAGTFLYAKKRGEWTYYEHRQVVTGAAFTVPNGSFVGGYLDLQVPPKIAHAADIMLERDPSDVAGDLGTPHAITVAHRYGYPSGSIATYQEVGDFRNLAHTHRFIYRLGDYYSPYQYVFALANAGSSSVEIIAAVMGYSDPV